MKYFIDPNNDKTYTTAVARITSCARKRLGLSLRQLSKISGMPHSTLSRIESEKTKISASAWFILCNSLKISPDSLKYGFIDCSHDDISSDFSGFELPVNYTQDAYFNIRDLLPLLKYIESFEKANFKTLFLRTLEIDPSYMFSLEHKVNLLFVSRLLEAAKKIAGFNDDERDEEVFISKLMEFTVDQMKLPLMHGKLCEKYSDCKSKMDLLALYIESKPKYESLYEYKMVGMSEDKTKSTIEVTPSLFARKNFHEMDLKLQLYLYDKLEKNILGMGNYPISDNRTFTVKDIKNPILNDNEKSFVFEVAVA